MKRRETILAIGLSAVGALWGADALYESLWQAPRDERAGQIERLQSEIVRRQSELRKTRQSIRRLDEWRLRSLPSDVEVARSLYQAWLLELVSRAGLDTPHVDSGNPTPQKGLYQSLAFTLRGRGSLDQVAQLLFAFYSAGHLHHARSITLTPVERNDLVELVMAIEAISLPDADRTDSLTMLPSGALASRSFADYQIIVDRNLFGAGAVAADPTSLAFLTAVIAVGGEREAWITLRASDEVLRLKRGDRLDIGAFHGTVADIDELDVVLESGQERWLMTIGESVAQASALPERW